jgi:hypothetical protein
VAESSGEVEQIDHPFGSQFGHRVFQGAVEVREIRGDVVAAEQRHRQNAPAVEDLIGKLASQHQIVGDALAGLLLGKPVERFDAGG